MQTHTSALRGNNLSRGTGDFGVQRHGKRRASGSRHHKGGEGSQGCRQATGSGWHQIDLPVCWEYLQQWVTHTHIHAKKKKNPKLNKSFKDKENMYFVFQLRKCFTTWSTMQEWLFALMPWQWMDMRCSLESITWVRNENVEEIQQVWQGSSGPVFD